MVESLADMKDGGAVAMMGLLKGDVLVEVRVSK